MNIFFEKDRLFGNFLFFISFFYSVKVHVPCQPISLEACIIWKIDGATLEEAHFMIEPSGKGFDF